MNLTIKLEPWLETNGLLHETTEYNIYTDKELTDVLETITDSDKLFLSVETDLPVGDTYYVVATRRFNVTNIDYESEVFVITNNGEEINYALLTTDVVIDKPMIIIERKDIRESVDKFTLKTSQYRGKGDGHTHSHWFIFDSVGLIDFRLNDTVNKTSIEINKNIIASKNNLTFKVIHCSNSIESDIGEYSISFNKVNFEITSQLVNVPISDFTVGFTKINKNKPMRLLTINIYNTYGDIVKIYEMSEPAEDVNSIVIPEDIIANNDYIDLEIYCYDEVNTLNKLIRRVHPIQNTLENHYIPDYEYFNNFREIDNFGILVPDNTKADIVNGEVFLPNGSIISKYYINTESGKISHLSDVKGVTLPTPNSEGTWISYTNDYLIVDTLENDKPTFFVYKYNFVTDTFVLLHTKSRDDIRTVSFNNNMVQISLYEYMYVPYGSNVIMKYNFKTNIITQLKTMPIETTSTVIIKLIDGRIMIIGNVDHMTYIYRPVENDFIDGVSVVPGNFIGKDLKVVELVNRDCIVIINNKIDKGVLYFDRVDYTLREVDVDLIVPTYNTVIPLNGYVGLACIELPDFVNTNTKYNKIGLYN